MVVLEHHVRAGQNSAMHPSNLLETLTDEVPRPAAMTLEGCRDKAESRSPYNSFPGLSPDLSMHQKIPGYLSTLCGQANPFDKVKDALRSLPSMSAALSIAVPDRARAQVLSALKRCLKEASDDDVLWHVLDIMHSLRFDSEQLCLASMLPALRQMLCQGGRVQEAALRVLRQCEGPSKTEQQ